jgi:predicted SAM-dependent methyltransferase
MMRMLNLGCGDRFHSDWVNLDVYSGNPDVQIADIRKGIPFSSDEFEVVYHSHVLEHLSRQKAKELIDECYRVLKPDGILRVVVPDLESVVREYLAILKMIDDGDQRGQARYDWILLELFDQFVRTRPGGEMMDYLRRLDNPEADYVVSRIGTWAEPLLNNVSALGANPVSAAFSTRLRYLLRRLRIVISGLWPARQDFIHRGERHQWMYDRYSLRLILESSGFKAIDQVDHNESRIAGWNRYHLDTEMNGLPANPGSLYLEAVKP